MINCDLAVDMAKSTKFESGLKSEVVLEKYGVRREEVLVGADDEKSVGVARGRYITLIRGGEKERGEDEKRYFIGIMAKALKEIISSASEKPFPSVLVIGLGNGLMTADALGKKVVEKIIATRQIPESQNLTTVSAFAAGVAGVTGIDSFEVVKGLKEEVKPDMIICVDALSAFSTDRIGRAFQISDAGIRAGGGSGKPSKYKLCRDTLGVPVLAVGVPFVVSAKKLLFEASGGKEFSNKIIPEGDMFVTPRDVDAILWDCSEIIGAALNCALHPDLGLSGALSLMS